MPIAVTWHMPPEPAIPPLPAPAPPAPRLLRCRANPDGMPLQELLQRLTVELTEMRTDLGEVDPLSAVYVAASVDRLIELLDDAAFFGRGASRVLEALGTEG